MCMPQGGEIIFLPNYNLCFQKRRGQCAAYDRLSASQAPHICLTAGAGLKQVTSGRHAALGSYRHEDIQTCPACWQSSP